MTTRTITDTLIGFPNAAITIERRTPIPATIGVYPAKTYAITTDSSGDFSIALPVPGVYYWTLPNAYGNQAIRTVIPDGDATTLRSLLVAALSTASLDTLTTALRLFAGGYDTLYAALLAILQNSSGDGEQITIAGTGGGGGAPSGPAGGVLSGTYPNPAFAVDMATQAELDSEANARQSADTTNATNLTTHISDTNNPHGVTKSQIGLANVDNTSDASKPVSSATQAALDAKTTALTDGPITVNMPRMAVSDAHSLTVGEIKFVYLHNIALLPITTLLSYCSSGGSSLSGRVGLYRVEANGNLTCVARSAVSSSLWTTGNAVNAATIVDDGAATPAAISSVTPTAGASYAVAFLLISASGAPTLGGKWGLNNAFMLLAPRVIATISGQTDLQPSYTLGSLGVTTAVPWCGVR